MNPFQGMGGLTRNPLGILAVFLGILYGIAGLLLGIDAQPLTEANQTVITWLVAIFPFVSLAVFAWLVSKHHAKLYSPHDYRTDEGFFASVRPSTAAEVEEKLAAEVDAISSEAETEPQSSLAVDAPEADGESGAESTPVDPVAAAPSSSDRRRQVYLAESMVLDRLGREFTSLKRQVKIETKSGRHIYFDAVGSKGDNWYIVEVVAARHDHTISMRARDIAYNIAALSGNSDYDGVIVVLCIVWLESVPENAERGVSQAKKTFADIGIGNVEVRQFNYAELVSGQ